MLGCDLTPHKGYRVYVASMGMHLLPYGIQPHSAAV